MVSCRSSHGGESVGIALNHGRRGFVGFLDEEDEFAEHLEMGVSLEVGGVETESDGNVGRVLDGELAWFEFLVFAKDEVLFHGKRKRKGRKFTKSIQIIQIPF